ncbi:FAD-binding oxidoreductase [Mycolicibacterium litorale]|uniref:FAD-linked oxidase n=1 Tax=Mycolicibacterium litorale TaxID=758802 RepID=A0AAD1MVD9_9MYCO|nr:FAD-binding oxidoreductase [Mycolicibacterium litorale]MCV7415940.1 FAD-binding oxidoreductase [Mycolicibacterium litorale]TDY09192.1 FAD/FMN-containing dehydrogenase [Mycolicibacterium litorale]BBY17131.1 FAD-linked oxidase [Mycolicibacterium litorale]
MTITDVARDDLADPVAAIRDHVSAPVAMPGEAGYERCAPWNVAAAVRPAAVVLATSAHDIADTVRFAAARGLQVTVQSTGHGATGVDEATILIVTSGMTACTVDALNRTARVGAGVRWQQVLDAACPYGLAPVVGSAPGVGVVGFLTGGGIGPLVRTVGASSDHVRAFELVTGTGAVLRVTPDEHADLFWGLRGGKATLGIVASVEFDLLPIPEFFGGAVYFDGGDAPAVLRAWADWCGGLPETVNTSIALQQLPPLPGVPEPLAGRLTVAVRYAALGDVAEAERILAPMRSVAPPVMDTVGVLPYAAIGAVHADPVDPMPVHEDHTLLHSFDPAAAEALLAVAGPGAESVQVIVEVRHLGGALAREPRHRSALCHRDAAFALTTIGALMPPIAEVVPVHAAAVLGALGRWSTGGQLPNFAPSMDPGRAARVYTEDARHWLAALAERYDPARVFRTGQVVRT